MTRAFLLSVSLLLAHAPCAAQDSDAMGAARAVFDEAARQFAARNYALAMRGFQDAHQQLVAAQHPRAGYTLYNIGRCYEELGQLADARDAFQRYLSDTAEDAPHRAEVSDRIRDLQARIELSGGGGSPAPAGGRENLSWVGWAVLGVGGAAILAGAITGGVALDQESQLAARCVDFVCDPSDASLIDSADALSVATDVLLFAGVGIAAVGLVLALVLDSGGGEAPTAGAFCTSDGCAVSVAHTF